MKTTIRHWSIMAILMVLIGASCEPIEDRMEMTGAINAEQLDITATPLEVNGKRSNKIVLDNKSAVLSSWDFGVGTTQRKSDTVLLVTTGDTDIVFTGLNPDGTRITKTLSVNVEELTFDVPLEWGYLTGGSEKEWVWDESKSGVWGNGGYLGSFKPEWWVQSVDEIEDQMPGEGEGAKMIFSLNGSKLTKVKADGQSESGSFSFDMSKVIKLDNGDTWARGKLSTNGVTILNGKSPDEGGILVYEFDIIVLNDTEMVLSYAPAGTGAWGAAFFWMFKAAD